MIPAEVHPACAKVNSVGWWTTLNDLECETIHMTNATKKAAMELIRRSKGDERRVREALLDLIDLTEELRGTPSPRILRLATDEKATPAQIGAAIMDFRMRSGDDWPYAGGDLASV